MKTIPSKQLKDVLDHDPNPQLIDVREADEFLAYHLHGSRCIPLSMLSRRLGEIDMGREVTLICQSGGRAGQAATQLDALGFGSVQVLEGGVTAWRKCGLSVRQARGTLPLQRQTMIGAGLVVLLGFLLGLWNPWFHAISAFAGAMLIVAGVTGFCFMAKALQRMPWNKAAVEMTESNGAQAKGAMCHGA